VSSVFARNVLWTIQQHSNSVNDHDKMKMSVNYFIGSTTEICSPSADLLSPHSGERIDI